MVPDWLVPLLLLLLALVLIALWFRLRARRRADLAKAEGDLEAATATSDSPDAMVPGVPEGQAEEFPPEIMAVREELSRIRAEEAAEAGLVETSTPSGMAPDPAGDEVESLEDPAPDHPAEAEETAADPAIANALEDPAPTDGVSPGKQPKEAATTAVPHAPPEAPQPADEAPDDTAEDAQPDSETAAPNDPVPPELAPEEPALADTADDPEKPTQPAAEAADEPAETAQAPAEVADDPEAPTPAPVEPADKPDEPVEAVPLSDEFDAEGRVVVPMRMGDVVAATDAPRRLKLTVNRQWPIPVVQGFRPEAERLVVLYDGPEADDVVMLPTIDDTWQINLGGRPVVQVACAEGPEALGTALRVRPKA